ncbi:PIG-L family deacetylase [candidate division WWE3 bacterium]|uniref:PIG-L family deacetylase n=1 Tax=candidate division WWE3 bacterium TaxID=2053526 RepID=A0A955RQ91_UNCKA|nr:PIG-L family deacetylase [candidate division WWE3 bacterium]
MIMVYWLHDHDIPQIELPKDKKILILFPHPDDECLTVGGTVPQLLKNNCEVTLVVLTKGERGTDDAHLDPQLGEIRTREMEHSARILGVTHLIQSDFEDGNLNQLKVTLQKYVHELLVQQQPDIVITYDLSGMYGHEDHIALSEAATFLMQKFFPEVMLWYASFPQKMYQQVSLPDYMATSDTFRSRIASPTARIYTGLSTLTKIQALYAHESQRYSFKKAFPAWLPLWFVTSLFVYEYFSIQE